MAVAQSACRPISAESLDGSSQIAIFLQAGEGVKERKSLKIQLLKSALRYHNQIFTRSQLFTNFDGYSLKNGAAMPLTISNFPRAWQAYFLSNTLQIWRENTSFDNLQMM